MIERQTPTRPGRPLHLSLPAIREMKKVKGDLIALALGGEMQSNCSRMQLPVCDG